MLNLYPHQEVAVDKMVSSFSEGRKGFSVNDDMGLGKTITTLSAIKKMSPCPTSCQCILIVPKAVINHWKDEINTVFSEDAKIYEYSGTTRLKKFKHFKEDDASYKFMLTTSTTLASDLNKLWCLYDKCSDLKGLRSEFAPCHNMCWDYLIVDESHTLRTPTTQTFQAVCVVNRDKTILLTGTPFNNTAMDIATQSHLLGMPLPLSTLDLSTVPKTITSAVKQEKLMWDIKEDSLKLFNNDIYNKKYSMVPFNKQLCGSFATYKHLSEILRSNSIHHNVLNVEKLFQTVVDADYRYRYVGNQWKYETFSWKKKIDSLKEKIKNSGFSDSPIKDIKDLNTKPKVSDASCKSSIIKEALSQILKLIGSEYYYEMLVSDDDTYDKIHKVLIRRAHILQWRCFWITGTENHQNASFIQLSRNLRDMFCIRRSKSDVPEITSQLPPMEIHNIEVKMDKASTKRHNDYKNEFLKAWSVFSMEKSMAGSSNSSKNLGRIMMILTRWRQVATCLELTTANQKDSTSHKDILKSRWNNGLTGTDITGNVCELLPDVDQDTYIPIAPTSEKIKKIISYTKEQCDKGEKVIVFSGWTTFLMILREHFIAENISVAMIDGSQSLKERNNLVKEYHLDDKYCVLLASIKACGVGLNLTVAQHAIFCEPSWNPFGEELQAMQRIHRIGQTKKTNTVYLISTLLDGKPSIDHFVRSLQDNKMLRAQSILGDSYLDKTQITRVGQMDTNEKGKLAKLASFIK